MFDTTPLRDSFETFDQTAAMVAAAVDTRTAPAPGEWHADRVLAHVAVVTAATVAAAADIAAGVNTAYDNRVAHDLWALDRVVDLSGGTEGIRDRIRRQGEALVALVGGAMSDAELDTLVPARLISKGAALVDQPMPLRALLDGIADSELPGHAAQLLALMPDRP